MANLAKLPNVPQISLSGFDWQIMAAGPDVEGEVVVTHAKKKVIAESTADSLAKAYPDHKFRVRSAP
jgi:hypothetical protein